MPHAHPDYPTDFNPADRITVPEVKQLYNRLIDGTLGIHEDVEVRAAQLESRIQYRGSLVCRVVPYRELFHVQIGGNPMWETRVRDAAGCADAMDRILARFLDLYASTDLG